MGARHFLVAGDIAAGEADLRLQRTGPPDEALMLLGLLAGPRPHGAGHGRAGGGRPNSARNGEHHAAIGQPCRGICYERQLPSNSQRVATHAHYSKGRLWITPYTGHLLRFTQLALSYPHRGRLRRRRNTQKLLQQSLSVAPVTGRPKHASTFINACSHVHFLSFTRRPHIWANICWSNF